MKATKLFNHGRSTKPLIHAWLINRAGSHPTYMGLPLSRLLTPNTGTPQREGGGRMGRQAGGLRGGSLTWEDEDEEGTDAANNADDLAEVRQEQGHGKCHGDPQDGHWYPDPQPGWVGQGPGPTYLAAAPPPKTLHHRPGGANRFPGAPALRPPDRHWAPSHPLPIALHTWQGPHSTQGAYSPGTKPALR